MSKPVLTIPPTMPARLRRRLTAQIAAQPAASKVKKKTGKREKVTNWFVPFRTREDFLTALAKATAKHQPLTLTAIAGKELVQRDIIRQIVRVHLDLLGLYPGLLVATSPLGGDFLVKVTRPRLVLSTLAAKHSVLFAQAQVI